MKKHNDYPFVEYAIFKNLRGLTESSIGQRFNHIF